MELPRSLPVTAYTIGLPNRFQTRGFGTYKHLFPLLLFQATIAHWFGAIACFDMGIFT